MSEMLTKEQFITAGKKEFLAKGYKEASLRQIAKRLGFTSGAFYGNFKSKADLFDAIVSQPAKELMDLYVSYHDHYLSQSPRKQCDHLGDISAEALNSMISYMYRQYDVFKLIFCRSSGTVYEQYLDQLIAVEVNSTKQFLQVMKENRYFSPNIDEQLCYILSSMLFNGVVAIFTYDMPYEYAIKYIRKLHIFYTAGWMKLFET